MRKTFLQTLSVYKKGLKEMCNFVGIQNRELNVCARTLIKTQSLYAKEDLPGWILYII